MNFPQLLKQGDKVVIVAPSGRLSAGGMDDAIGEMTSWGLEVILGEHVYDIDGYFAGKDEDRLADLQGAFDDPAVTAILCARGGYGATRILQSIAFKNIIKTPKWLIGFSDITALHLQLQNLGIASIHGPVGTSFSNNQSGPSLAVLKSVLFNGSSNLFSSMLAIREGMATSQITGGNLSLIVDSLATENEIDTSNKILFLEEVGEKTYRIDRMLYQLLRAGKLTDLSGLVIGHFTDIEEGSTPFGKSWLQVIIEITKSFGYPVASGFKIGHEPENLPIVMGGFYHLNVAHESATLSLQPDSSSENEA
jgi:muramoyltetrapeptide carboxypeptidase